MGKTQKGRTVGVALRQNARQILSKFQEPFMRLPGKSILESLSLKPATLVDYMARILTFVNICKENGLDWSCEETLGIALLGVFDFLLLEEFTPGEASKMLAAIKYYMPRPVIMELYPCPGHIELVALG